MLGDYMEDFILLERTDTPDETGGIASVYEESMAFRGGVTAVMASEIDIAQRPARRLTPVLVHEWGVTLRQGDVVRRVSDGRCYRVTGHSSDMRTPLCAGFAFAQVPVEGLVSAP